MPAPTAGTITVRATLAMLDGPKREIADGVTNDQYVFWLGSGISRERMPDLRDVAKRVMIALQSRIQQADPNCRFRKALNAVVVLANPSPDEWRRIAYVQAPDSWLDFDVIAARLVNNYARMLNVNIDGEEPDFILWNVLDAAHVYADQAIEPDAEHLCLAALAIEGVASEMPTANWDCLIERAVRLLAGDRPVLRVVVAPNGVRSNRLRANLYKFHGCAQAALEDEAQFREMLVARSSQINGWVAQNPVMAPFLINFIVTRPTLMLGLSAQDSNIQGLFASAQAAMPWRWPSHPPAYAFSENALGADQEGLLQNVYHHDYSPANRPSMEAEALVQAYAKPLLLSLFLYVVTAKLKVLLTIGLPGIADADRNKLHEGLDCARNLVADGVVPSAAVVTELFEQCGRTMSMLRDGKLPDPVKGLYAPITAEPLHRMPADLTLASSGTCQFAIASGLIGLGLARGLWTAAKADVADSMSGAVVLTGRSGAAKIYFAANAQAAIRLGTNGLIAANDDAVIVHSHENPPPLPRYPRRAPGRTGLARFREVSIEDLVAGGTEVEDLLARFRSKVAL
ncbi:SIR2 family protein [Bradyrhizobium sp. th.b2]|uniref:SIR2 family protein n=1 Tax=Bradyrhizobium sp. th-b2 TaxID=172088 RepID=UPI000424A42A|nr:SIR2 family protein [Bradyrhizobium sp. th.b2]